MSVRVAGRIDLAEPVHRALLAAGVEAHLATGAPRHVARSTGSDGATLDVLVNDLELCSLIKRGHPARPVVFIAAGEEAEAHTEVASALARTSRGPDALMQWPVQGDQLRAACDRARAAAAGPRRPRFTFRTVMGPLILVAVLAVLFWSWSAELFSQAANGPGARAGPWPRFVGSLLPVGLLYPAWYLWARAEGRRRRVLSVLLVTVSAVSAIGAVSALAEALLG